MIRSIRGQVTLVKSSSVWLETQSRVGYEVFSSKRALELNPGDETVLYTSLIVRENLMALYGFLSMDEVEVFEKLLLVSGVGPKSALSLMNIGPLPDLKSAISTGNSSYLSTASGVGKRTAEKIIIELKDKCDWDVSVSSSTRSVSMEVSSALVSLGYAGYQIREVLLRIDGDLAPEEQIRQALKIIGENSR